MQKYSRTSRLIALTALILVGITSTVFAYKVADVKAETLREASITKQTRSITGVARSESKNRYLASKLDSINELKLPSGTTHRKDSKPSTEEEVQCKSIVYQTLLKLPTEHVSQLKSLTLFYTTDGRRGLGGGSSIILRCKNVSDAEVAGVLVHEIGHITDENFLQGSKGLATKYLDFGRAVLSDDPSSYFYAISWASDKEKLSDATEADFVSGYAMSDPFEEFAESYAYYILHGEEFRALSANNFALKQKYQILKKYVFDGKEFANYMPNNRTLNKEEREYDVTVMPYEFRAFIAN